MATCFLKLYSQPDIYRLNQDSLELVSYVLKNLNEKDELKVLDIGAGCGVIGIELYLKAEGRINHVDFVEKQNIFLSHLNKNRQNIKSSIFHRDWLSDFNIDNDYDIIATNPPYFFKSDSRSSSIPERDICRRIAKDDLVNWLDKANLHLKEKGLLFISFRDSQFINDYITKNHFKWRLINLKRNEYCTIFCLEKSFVEYKD